MEKDLERFYEVLTDNIELFGLDEVETFVTMKDKIKKLQHHKDTTVGLYATDKEPEKLFEEVFVNLIEEIGMDGNQTFSPMDYEYYRDMFNKGIKMLMFRIS